MSDKKLHERRQEIDRIDEQLISLLAQRLKLADDLVTLKRKLKLGIKDTDRELAVIDRVRKRARELGIDPGFAESVMWLVIAQMAGEERERFGGVEMWSNIQNAFSDYPAQLSVARVLFKYGLRVKEDGDIACGNIRISAVQIAKEADVDRRVVDATAKRILADDNLNGIFMNLEPFSYLKGVAQELGLGVIEILPNDAVKPGVLKDVTSVISKFGISIRQVVADDPHFVPQPKLTIITDKPLQGSVIDALRKLTSVQSVIVY